MRSLNRSKRTLLFDLYRKRTSFPVLVHVIGRYITAPLEEIERHVPKVGRILDLGCGVGLFSHLMYLASKKRQITGVDIDEWKINKAKMIAPDNENTVFTTESVDTFGEKEFDAVAVVDVLYLIPSIERKDLLKVIYGMLKDDGVLMIKTMDPELKLKFLWNCIQEFISVKIIKMTKAKEKQFYYIKDINCFKDLLREIGFRVETLKIDKNFLHPHILLLCRKQISVK